MPDSLTATGATTAMDAATSSVLLAWQELELSSRRMREKHAELAGVSLNDFQAMIFLSETDRMTPKDIGRKIHLSTGAMTALIDRLETAGLLTRQPHPTDRRSTQIVLTTTGLSAVTSVGEIYADVVSQMMDADERRRVGLVFLRLASLLDSHRNDPR